ncbi:hypothetical protein DFH07DRAFT_773634 [Mycena maculata]|uniref:Uncharacterized protein n=1 Tax=Mycena maculata TaxID=230809 RepID=A0AAD7J2J4_9AGAR|nr:hypothetical protein DFH07DRAFT_773634 [Mycena maculata]
MAAKAVQQPYPLLSLSLPTTCFLAPPMPMFSSSSDVQINGGTFIDSHGSVNIHTTVQGGEVFPSLDFSSDRQHMLAAHAQRPDRRRENARMIPYDISRRPRMRSSSHSSSNDDISRRIPGPCHRLPPSADTGDKQQYTGADIASI